MFIYCYLKGNYRNLKNYNHNLKVLFKKVQIVIDQRNWNSSDLVIN